MASFLNGLSAMGAGISTFAGNAGLEQQRADLARQGAILADQLATTRETALEGQRQQFQTGLEGQRQTFQAGQTDKEIAAKAAEGALTRSGDMARTQATEEGAMARTRAQLDAPTPEIKSAKLFATLTPDEKQAYREEMMTKAGLPAWMIGGGDTPSSPTGSGAITDMPGGVAPDGSTASPSAVPVSAPDPGVTRNDKALQGVPGAAASIVKGMVDGRISPPSSFAMSKPYWQGLISKAAEYDPTFDQTTWAGRVATRKDFAAGKSAQAVTALNTALGHAGVVDDALTALNNGNIPILNSMENWTIGAFGSARPTNANMAVDALASEARKVFAASGGGNLSELQEWQKNFPINGSPAQQKGAMGQFVNLLDSRLAALSDQYNRGMGRTDDPMSLLQPHARAIYEKLTGREPTGSEVYQMGTPPAGTPAASAAPPSAIPSWVKPGDQYSPSRGQARGADGTVYGPPQ